MTIVKPLIDPVQLQEILSRHLAVYARKQPFYQAEMLNSLLELWQNPAARLLDIGGGTGVIAQAMAELFPVSAVQAIDVVDRFAPDLTVGVQRYDGQTMPFENGWFDAATLNNVLHHVPVAARAGLMHEVRRVVAGPVYIKDHLCAGPIDHFRLVALDAWGNIPFGGMVKATYLTNRDWEQLAADAGFRIGGFAAPRNYRTGLAAVAFPNRLEVTMRLDPM